MYPNLFKILSVLYNSLNNPYERRREYTRRFAKHLHRVSYRPSLQGQVLVEEAGGGGLIYTSGSSMLVLCADTFSMLSVSSHKIILL